MRSRISGILFGGANARDGIQPSAKRPVTASERLPNVPSQIGMSCSGLGSRSAAIVR
jgi:hypothetical protein